MMSGRQMKKVASRPAVPSARRSKFDFDRQDKHGMESQFFWTFQHLESGIRSRSFVQSDAPDFRTGDDTRPVVGVEVTRVFQKEARLDLESTKDGVLESARAAAVELQLAPADVTFFFSLDHPLNAQTRRRIAAAAVRVVAMNMPQEGHSTCLEYCDGQPREVDLILVNRVHCGRRGEWRWLEAGRVDIDPSDVIDDAIARKATRLPQYMNACDECWLLLVADSFRPSAKFTTDAPWTQKSFPSPFARTYFLNFERGILHRLSGSSSSADAKQWKSNGAWSTVGVGQPNPTTDGAAHSRLPSLLRHA